MTKTKDVPKELTEAERHKRSIKLAADELADKPFTEHYGDKKS